MAYLQLYRDSSCTNLFMTIPTAEINCTPSTTPRTLTYNGITYKYFDWNDYVLLQQVPIITQNPPFLTSRNRVPTDTDMYFKNGVVVGVRESTNNGIFEHFRFGNNDLSRSNNTTATENNPARLFAISFSYDGVKYIGFTDWFQGTQANYFRAVCCIEASFWQSALRPPYDYSAGTDSDGGQATGTIPNNSSTESTTPSKIIPTGGRGLHSYLINISAYGDIQGYLWGDNTTLAKSLWQKFLNKTHSPVNCVLGCYSLPAVFMPSASGNTGVHIAGVYLTPISGTCSSVNLGFIDKELVFPPLDAPFRSFADYTCIACKLHLPIVGDITIPAEFVINKTVTVRYRVDQFNGNTVARVKSAGQTIAELSGNCAYNLPITGGDDGTLDRLGALSNVAIQLSAGNVAGALAQSAAGLGAQFQTQVANSNFNGNTTACQNGYAYIEYIYPTTNYPAQYGQVYGYACSVSGVLSDFKGGYGEFEVNLGSMAIPCATQAEKDEIRSLLQGGVMV